MPIGKEEVSYEFDVPIPDGIPKGERKNFLKEVGSYLVDAMLDSIGDGVSPVTGKPFKELSKKYADKEKGGKRLANLDLTGDMLNALTYKIEGNKVIVGVFDKEQAIKLYNHNVGDTVPQRQVVPNEKQAFNKKIMEGIEYITEDYSSGDESKAADR